MPVLKKRIFGARKWWLPVATALLLKCISFYPSLIERFYSNGVYIFIGKLQRFLIGWLPFSIGDVLYFCCAVWLLYSFIRFVIVILRNYKDPRVYAQVVKNILYIILWVYVVFYTLWGLNYNRRGIAYQLELPLKTFSVKDVDTITFLLHQRLNQEAVSIHADDWNRFAAKAALFNSGKAAYKKATAQHRFLNLKPYSTKPSLYSYLMNYTGVQGYYNPFTGEAQVNTTIPLFVRPFIVTHEMAHQLGYAKEHEANFVGFLVSKSSGDKLLKYSADLAMYMYSVNELYLSDSVKAAMYDASLHPSVKDDLQENTQFYRRYANKVEPVISWLYGNYLKANNQPSGNRSYSEVVVWLIAYYKKYGINNF